MSYASLCFLSYERPDFLMEAVTTALNTVHEPVELIIHDDGSLNPKVWQMLNDFAMMSEAASTIIRNPPGHNQGQGVALNRMFNIASGDPIIKLDQDLIFKDGWLRGVQQIVADPRVGLCGLFKYWHDPVDHRKTGVDIADWPSTYEFHTHICGSGFAVPRRIWEGLGPFGEHWADFGEDWDFQKRVHAAFWYNALPREDLVTNQGFGLGPSTVVVAGPGGAPTVTKIHKQPRLVGGPR